MQETAPKEAYYKNNHFISFSLAIASKKATVLKTIMLSLQIEEDEAIEYIRALREINCLSEEDDKLLSRVTKIKDSDNQFKEQIEEIIDHLAKLTKRQIKVTPTRTRRIKSLLSSKEYSVQDFKAVNEYFVKDWENNPSLKQYLVPETLYNEKFQSRVETSGAYKDNMSSYLEDIDILYEALPEMFKAELPENTIRRDNGSRIQIPYKREEDECIEVEIEASAKDIPQGLKVTIIHWLENGYTREVIEHTIRKTAEAWSRKSELLAHISIGKILDEKFPERVRAVRKILEKEKSPMLKTSALAVDAWDPNK